MVDLAPREGASIKGIIIVYDLTYSISIFAYILKYYPIRLY